jgi:hypothetical protein
VNAVRWHHNPERNKKSTTKSDITYLSNLICQPRGDNSIADGQPVLLSSAVLDRMEITVNQYEAIAAKTHSWLTKFSDTLTFD